MKAEMETCMRLLGVEKVSDLGPRHVSELHIPTNPPAAPYSRAPHLVILINNSQINSRMVERDIFDGGSGLDTFGLWEKVRSRL